MDSFLPCARREVLHTVDYPTVDYPLQLTLCALQQYRRSNAMLRALRCSAPPLDTASLPCPANRLFGVWCIISTDRAVCRGSRRQGGSAQERGES